jgi:hypothetical protein
MLNFKAAVQRTAAFVDRWHWLLLVLTAPFLLFPTPSRTVALLIVPGLWIVARLAGNHPIPHTPFNIVLLLISLMVLVSLYATYSISVSLPAIAGVVLGMGIYCSITRAGQHARGWWLSFIVFAGLGLSLAGLGLFGTHWIAKIAFLTPIIKSLPPVLIGLPGIDDGLHPNEVAGALLWVMPALIVLSGWLLTHIRIWWSPRKWIGPLAATGLVIAATLLVTGTFVLTQSRSGYLAIALSSVVLTFVLLPKQRGRFLFGVFTALVITIGLAYLFFGYSSVSPSSTDESLAADPALSLDTLEGRTQVWLHALYAIQDFPITGMGLNTFQHIVQVFYPMSLFGPNYDIGHAHDEFLQIALDLGLPGLIAFLSLYMVAFWMLREIWNEAGHSTVQISILHVRLSAPGSLAMAHTLVLGLTGGLLSHLFFGLTDATPLGSKYGVLFWMLLGLIAGLFLQTRPDHDLTSSTDRGIIDTNATQGS